jgi:hypothetical protein
MVMVILVTDGRAEAIGYRLISGQRILRDESKRDWLPDF